MIEEKYVKVGEEKYYYQYGMANINEILQNNISKHYPDNLTSIEDSRLYRFIQYDFFAPGDAVKEMKKQGKINDTIYKTMHTVKEGSKKYRLILDGWNT